MSDLSQLARQQGDNELTLSKPLEVETYNEVLYLLHVIGRAQEALMASRRSLEARKVPMATYAFEKAYWALEGVYANVSPLVLAHALARNAQNTAAGRIC